MAKAKRTIKVDLFKRVTVNLVIPDLGLRDELDDRDDDCSLDFSTLYVNCAGVACEDCVFCVNNFPYYMNEK